MAKESVRNKAITLGCSLKAQFYSDSCIREKIRDLANFDSTEVNSIIRSINIRVNHRIDSVKKSNDSLLFSVLKAYDVVYDSFISEKDDARKLSKAKLILTYISAIDKLTSTVSKEQVRISKAPVITSISIEGSRPKEEGASSEDGEESAS